MRKQQEILNDDCQMCVRCLHHILHNDDCYFKSTINEINFPDDCDVIDCDKFIKYKNENS